MQATVREVIDMVERRRQRARKKMLDAWRRGDMETYERQRGAVIAFDNELYKASLNPEPSPEKFEAMRKEIDELIEATLQPHEMQFSNPTEKP